MRDENCRLKLKDDSKEEDDKGMWRSTSLSSKYGWGKFTPNYLQFLNSPKWFLATVVVYCMVAGITLLGLSTLTLPTIEKRFSFTSTEVGVIASAIDITALAIGIVISYYGDYVNKIRCIAAGAALGGIGAFLFAVPHFLIGPYKPVVSELSVSPLTCTLSNDTADSFDSFDCIGSERHDWYYLAIFIISQLISGASLMTLNSLVPPYLDENVEPKHMPLYLGVWYGASLCGPSAGIFVAGSLLNVYVDIEQPDGISLTTDDLEWIGAWWLGYVCFSALFFLCSIIILGYPRHLPGAIENREMHRKAGDIRNVDDSKEGKLANFLPQLKCLLTNRVFLFNCLGLAAISIFEMGFIPFYAKFGEMKFGVDTVTFGYISSAVLLPVTLGGTFVGSFIVQRFSLATTCKKSALLLVITSSAIVFCPLFLLIPGCENTNIAGISHRYSLNSSGSPAVIGAKLNDRCNNNCSCSMDTFSPVCGTDNITYFSACYAGCIVQNSNETFTNCSCIYDDYSGEFNGMAKLGFCDRDCKNFVIFMVIFSIQLFGEFIGVVPSQTVILRCVPDNKRSFAIGMQLFMIKVLAFIPGPIIFGHLLDTSCRLWEDICGDRGRCFDYDITLSSLIIAVYGCLSLGAAVLLFFISWYSIKKETETKNIVDSDNSDMTPQLKTTTL